MYKGQIDKNSNIWLEHERRETKWAPCIKIQIGGDEKKPEGAVGAAGTWSRWSSIAKHSPANSDLQRPSATP